MLDESQQDRLRHEMELEPPDQGVWSGRAVGQWIAGLLGRLVAPRRATAYLRRLGFTRQVPRPRHAEADAGAQEVFKARFRARIQALQRQEPDTPLEVWAFDEHRLGLKPILRRIWAPRGRRPVARGHQRFRWLYVYGFVRPATGEVVWFLAETVNAVMLSRILAAFAREVGAGSGKRIVLVLDGAGWHVAGDLEIPEGIALEFLPGYSPELQPAEHLWPIVDESVANRYFEDIQALDQAVGEYCCTLVDDRDRIRANTLFHWWPAFA